MTKTIPTLAERLAKNQESAKRLADTDKKFVLSSAQRNAFGALSAQAGPSEQPSA